MFESGPDLFPMMSRDIAAEIKRNNDPATVARYSMGTQASPRLIYAISLAERFHVAHASSSNGSLAFGGCDEYGRPLKRHRHVHTLCESLQALGRGKHGEITNITIFLPWVLAIKNARLWSFFLGE